MTEMEPHQAEIDNLLRRSMAAPVPALSANFDKRLMRKVQPRSESLERLSRLLFIGYALMSVFVSTIIMRGQGLAWSAIAIAVLLPLTVVAVARAIRPQAAIQHTAK